MTENRKNWLYPEASGLYFPHDGFVMRATDGKQYDYEEECELLNQYDKKYNEYHNEVLRLTKENKQLKQQVNCHKSRIELLSPLLDLADTIIDLSDDEKAKAFWEKRNNEVEQEWNKILKGDVE